MDKRLYICAAVILIFALLGLLAYSKLELFSRKISTLPSREVLANNFFAMEQWLNSAGRRVRIEKQYNSEKIAAAPERVVVAQSSACAWKNADTIIPPWIEKGGFLVITLDDDTDEALLFFLSGFGISIEEIDVNESHNREMIPDFTNDIYFSFDNEDEVFTINDSQGNARLAEISLGEGALTVIGRPRFMYNDYLSRDINARLAWDLTGARANENQGVLFIRDRYIPKALFGKIMERGNLAPVGISALLIIFLGFWMVIPAFGLVLNEKQKTARPIRQRFIAEIRFLKKYRSLNHYVTVYERELKLEGDPEMSKTYKYRELINKLREYESMPEGVKWNSQKT